MSRSTGGFDELLDQATSNIHLEPDWHKILDICELIKQRETQPKYALLNLHHKLTDANPHVATYGLLVLESCVKNCGSLIHDEIGTREYMEQMHDLVNYTRHEDFKNKILELLQAWAYAFRNSPKYRAVQDVVEIMKARNCTFPALKGSDATFSADPAPTWVNGVCCYRCRIGFSMIPQQKHHCHACGKVFCGHCTRKTAKVPRFSILMDVRICESCYNAISRPIAIAGGGWGARSVENLATSPDWHADVESPAAYLSCSPGHQTQSEVGARRLALALPRSQLADFHRAMALSQSEIEETERRSMCKTVTVTPLPESLSMPVPAVIQTITPSTSVEPAHFANNIADTLKKQLECPVCMNLATKPIYMCTNGHNVCSTCQPQLFECPVCRKDGRPSIRNLFAEELAQSALVKCNNSDRGCTEAVMANAMESHLKECKFNFECLFESCQWQGSVANLAIHARNFHRENFFEIAEGGIVLKLNDVDEHDSMLREENRILALTDHHVEGQSKVLRYSTAMLLFKNYIFWYHTEVSDQHSFSVQLQRIGPICEADQTVFSYKLKFLYRLGAGKFTYKNIVRTLKTHDYFDQVFVDGISKFYKDFSGDILYSLKLFVGTYNVNVSSFSTSAVMGLQQLRTSMPKD